MIRCPRLLWRILSLYPLLVCFIALSSSRGIAQVTPDTTLGGNQSQVNPIDALSDRIDGGALRGSNLFHSFQRFDIEAGRSVYFNDRGAANIFSRVTGGGLPSSIDGTLGAYGTANLFLINPNGITFGAGARLVLGGSFVATTANSVLFDKGGTFSASNPTAPPLLTVETQAPIGLQFEGNAKPIQAQGSNLTLPSGNMLALIGGDLNVVSSQLTSVSGRVELAAVAGVGTVGLDRNIGNLVTSLADSIERADINLTGGSKVDASGALGGSVQVQGRNVILSGVSSIRSDTTGKISGKGGSITVKASEMLQVTDGTEPTGAPDKREYKRSEITTSPQAGSTGNGGDITISAPKILIQNGARITTVAKSGSQGNAGNLTIEKSDLLDISAPDNGLESGVYTSGLGSGNSGELKINTGRLILKDGGQVVSGNLLDEFEDEGPKQGSGKSGDLSIFASESVDVIGTSTKFRSPYTPFLSPTGIFSFTTNPEAAGDITIFTQRLSVKDGASIAAGNDNGGTSGNITIAGFGSSASNYVTAEYVKVVGNSDESQGIGIGKTTPGLGNGSRIRSTTGSNTNAGNILIQSDKLVVEGAARIDTRTIQAGKSETKGKAGDITVNSRMVSLSDGGQIISTTQSKGDAGTITINATEQVSLSGIDTSYDQRSKLLENDDIRLNEGNSSGVVTKAKKTPQRDASGKIIKDDSSGKIKEIDSLGNGGSIIVNTPKLAISSAAVLNAQALSQGKGGAIQVHSQDVVIQSGGQIRSDTSGSGDAGKITIDTSRLSIQNGAQVLSSTSSKGQAGSIKVTAPEFIQLNNTSTLSVEGLNGGSAGDLNIVTRNLRVEKGSTVNVSSPTGQAGNLDITAGLIVLNQGNLTAETGKSGVKEGANISLKDMRLLWMYNDSLISAKANKSANGGNIIINSSSGLVITSRFENSDIIANADFGNGGNVEITAQSVFGLQQRRARTLLSDVVVSSRFGLDGNFTLSTGIDPTSGLTQALREPRSINVADNCQVSSGKESIQFFDIGRGGLPPRPEDPLSIDLLEWAPTPIASSSQPLSANKASQTPPDQPYLSSQASIATPKLLPPCQSH